jgi:hypothetical protein
VDKGGGVDMCFWYVLFVCVSTYLDGSHPPVSRDLSDHFISAHSSGTRCRAD